jgi:predicted metal-dependent hydrolase
MHFAPGLIDYVVAHELAHLKEMNHGPRFWAVVERLYPDWKNAKAEIRRLAPTLPQI